MSINSRPKRKATINKNYNDPDDNFIDSDQEEEQEKQENQELSTANSSSTSINSTPTATEGRTTRRSTAAAAAAKSNNKKSKENTKGTSPAAPAAPSKPPLPYNWQPPITPEDYFSNKLDLSDAYIDLNLQILYCPNQTIITNNSTNNNNNTRRKNSKSVFSLSKGQYIYLICEPPGDPYYVGRILGFKHKNHHGETKKPKNNIVDAKDYEFQIQWFYRPRDISKTTSDSRLLYSSMHSDSCPLMSYRGLVTVKHKQDIEDEYNKLQPTTTTAKRNTNNKKSSSPSVSPLEIYTSQPNCFYFNQLFDRYMIKFYDVLSTINLMQYSTNDSKSRNFLIAIHKRFEFIFVESTRTKSLINSFSADSCNCELCGLWCVSQDSVNCIECNNYYHMYCLDPPLLKKPSRGFSWSCATCTKKHEIEYHQKKILMLSHDNKSSNQDQLNNELNALSSLEEETGNFNVSDDQSLPKYEIMATLFLEEDKENSIEQRRILEEWPMRYLGVNARLEEGVDLTDKTPYPRASTRLGAKHQAVYIPECNGHPIVYYDVEDKSPKKKITIKDRKKTRDKQETIKQLKVPEEYKNVDPKDYPSWLQPRPKGYTERGVDDGDGDTVTLLWKTSELDRENHFANLNQYIQKCKSIAENLGLSPNSPNFYDAILLNYMKFKGDIEMAYLESSALTKKKLHEPVFTKEEVKRFENAVKEFGSELYPVYSRVKTQPSAMIVRFWYLWKKTKNGALIWGNYEGRVKKSKVQNKTKEEEKKVVVIDDLANSKDDSSFENEKIISQKKKFNCKHCNTHSSIQWYRITGIQDSKKLKDEKFVSGLCFRCAKLWRRYAVIWEDPNEVQRKLSNNKYSGWKKKIESELVNDSNRILAYAEEKGMSLNYDKIQDGDTIISNKLPKPVEEIMKKENKRKLEETVSTPKKKTKVKKEEEPKKSKNKPGPKPGVPRIPKNVTKVIDSTGRNVMKVVGTDMKPIEIDMGILPYDYDVMELETKEKVIAPILESSRPIKNEKVYELIFNKNYKTPNLQKLKAAPSGISADFVDEMVKSFRINQLADVYSKLQIKNQNLSIGLPFSQNKRKCSICREDDHNQDSINEMLICASCGVNIHSSCANLNINKRSQREWVCDCCINDMKPINSCNYNCCLCLANETNYELSITGNEKVIPDYLKPITNGKWCHLSCAMFNNNILFRKKENKLIIEDVSKIFINNHDIKCGICDSYNGSLINCELCDRKFHITCAQDSPNYKIGFRLINGKEVEVGDKIGKLKSVLICPNHQKNVLNLRTMGRRTSSRLEKPLIQLYLEDLLNNIPKYITSGANLKSLIYAENCKLLNEDKVSKKEKLKECIKCKSDMSPMWWPSVNDIGVVCQSCHFDKNRNVNVDDDDLISMSQPINGENYGIKNSNDSVVSRFKPKLELKITQQQLENLNKSSAIK
ncbi:unnamed protein product [Candida verbasci]|uniref:Uncharacterized protein n=1 Tax=Candida verbasci TaxID=1227364 RepID=A0A9W4XB80_9ASCO|nr:unnamed protein product [Candida verbasci]